MINRCSMTGEIIDVSSDAIWDDGEWISWDWINQEIYNQELKKRYPKANLDLIQMFEELVNLAKNYKFSFISSWKCHLKCFLSQQRNT